jgi:AcrR family transcriptional regulator
MLRLVNPDKMEQQFATDIEATMQKPKNHRTLTKEKVLTAAAVLIEEQGADALSMRHLATTLGVEAMSLYNHIADKDDLLDGVANRLLEGFKLPRPSGQWQTDIRTLFMSFRETAMASPQQTRVLLSRQVFGSAILRLTEVLLSSFKAGGLSTREGVLATRLLVTFLAGALLREAPHTTDSSIQEHREELAKMADRGLPVVAQAAEYLAPPTGFLDFEFGLDLILSGLEKMHTETR